MNKKIFITGLILVIIGAAGVSFREASADNIKWEKSKDGLGALIDYAKSAGQMEKDSKEEDEYYEKAKEALASGEFKEGMTGAEVEAEIGAPVVKVPSPSGERVKWVYKKGSASYFEGNKVYLYFDNKDLLQSWEFIPEKDKEKGTGPGTEVMENTAEVLEEGADTAELVLEKKDRTRSANRSSGLGLF